MTERARAFAARLNGREYGEEITTAEEGEAKELGLLIVFGASDDLTEFRGVLDDERGAWEGASHVLFRGPDGGLLGLMHEADRDELIRQGWTPPKPVLTVTAIWSPQEGEEGDGPPWASWSIVSDAPFAPFDIMEDGELYCRGAVIEVPAPDTGE